MLLGKNRMRWQPIQNEWAALIQLTLLCDIVNMLVFMYHNSVYPTVQKKIDIYNNRRTALLFQRVKKTFDLIHQISSNT